MSCLPPLPSPSPLEHPIDAGVILGVVIINALIGFLQEGKAEKALEAVHAMLATHAMVLREGERHEIDVAELVPGDIVLLESGDGPRRTCA